MNFLLKKFGFNKGSFSAQVFVVGMILSATFFLFSIDLFKVYRSEISILVNVKSEVDNKQQEQIINNIAELPKTLAFYDGLLKYNPDVRDVTTGFSADKRKERWNKMLSVNHPDLETSIIKIAITTSHKADSEQLAIKTARTLFDTSAFYYNIKKDVDLRIVDGPITSVLFPNWFLFFVLSIALGFTISETLQYLAFGDKKILIKKPDFSRINSFFEFKKAPKIPVEEELEMLNNLYRTEQAEQEIILNNEIKSESLQQEQENNVENLEYEKRFQEMKKITKSLEPDKYPNFPEMPLVREVSKASAPDNLPIADDSFFVQSEEPAKAIKVEETVEETNKEEFFDITKEPTQEELKKRLNELLKGNI